MKKGDFLSENYINFGKFLSVVAARELEYFILDSKFTTDFNYRIKKIIKEVKNEGKKDAELSVLYNTEGEIALIDAQVLGDFISNSYIILIRKYYKDMRIDKILTNIRNGGDKAKLDFVKISYSILYKVIEEIYMEIKCKKDIKDKYLDKYNLKKYTGNDSTAIVVLLLILEDICKYQKIDTKLFYSHVNQIILSKNT